VIDGLKPGEEIVTSSQFLIDSESKLREATAKMMESAAAKESSKMEVEAADAGDEHDHGAENGSVDAGAGQGKTSHD